MDRAGGLPLSLPSICGQVFRRQDLKSYSNRSLSHVLERQASTRIQEAPLAATEVTGVGVGGQEPRGRDLGVGERAPSSECFSLVLRLGVSGDRGGGGGDVGRSLSSFLPSS